MQVLVFWVPPITHSVVTKTLRVSTSCFVSVSADVTLQAVISFTLFVLPVGLTTCNYANARSLSTPPDIYSNFH